MATGAEVERSGYTDIPGRGASQSVIMDAWTILGRVNTSRLPTHDEGAEQTFQSCCAVWRRKSRNCGLSRWRYSI
jgi:hypothetical protein